MENQNAQIAEEAVLEQAPVAEETQVESAEMNSQEEPVQEMSELQKLTNQRTGFWPIGLETADLKWIKNQCNNKFEFTGPNEAFMLMNCYLGFASALARQEEAQKGESESGPAMVQAAAIEACALMINRHHGSGLDAAQRVFRIAVALNAPIMEMKRLDEQIAVLKQAEQSVNSAEPQA